MTWHPPIPTGLATDTAVRELKYKMALHLLLYCYDDVRRDGTVKISLKEVARELQEPYETVRRWWRSLLDGPFFAKQRDCGRNGWEVQFAPDWIDWHVMSNNYQRSPMNGEAKPETPSTETERSPMNEQKLNITASFNPERSPVNVEKPAYKVLHDDHESGGGGNNFKGSSPPPFFEKLAEVCKIDLKLAPANQRSQLGEAAAKLSSAGATVEQLDAFSVWWWSDSNWRTRKANKNRLKPEAPRPREVQEEWGNAVLPAANGHKPNGRGPPGHAPPWKPPDDALSGADLQEAIAAAQAKKR